MPDQSSDTLRHGAMILAGRRRALNKKSLRYRLKYRNNQTSDFPIFNQGNLGCEITNVKMLISQNVLQLPAFDGGNLENYRFGYRRQIPPQKQYQFKRKQKRCQRFCQHLFKSLSKKYGIASSHSSQVRVGQWWTASPARTYHLSFASE